MLTCLQQSWLVSYPVAFIKSIFIPFRKSPSLIYKLSANQARESDTLGLDPSLLFPKLCDLGYLTRSLCVSSSI